MKIKEIQLEYAQHGGRPSRGAEGLCHVKTLPYFSIAQAVQGYYEIKLGNRPTQKTGKAGFFLAPAQVQQTIVHHDDADGAIFCRWVFLRITVNGLYDWDDVYEYPVILPEMCKAEMNAIFDRLFAAADPFTEYVCYYEIIRLLSQVSREKGEKKPVYVNEALAYIRRHYQEKLTVETLAASVNLSASYFFSVFKKAMGVSPIAYLNNFRLSMAVEQLLNTEHTVTEIARAVGIGDPVYFNKLFRKAYQMSPTRYRVQYRADG